MARSRQHENPSLPNCRSRKPEEIGRRSRRALTHAVAHSQAVSIVHGRLIGSAFATAPVLCLTLAKWETVSGQFGGYLTLRTLHFTHRGKLKCPQPRWPPVQNLRPLILLNFFLQPVRTLHADTSILVVIEVSASRRLYRYPSAIEHSLLSRSRPLRSVDWGAAKGT